MSSNLANTIEKVLSDERDVRAATVSHQAEFPYDRSDEAQVTRREFCNFLFVTSGALFVGAAGFAAASAYEAQFERQFPQMKIEGAENLQPGSALNFRYPTIQDPAILIRARDGEYYAYDQKCTHLSCPVYYAKEADRLECPCHEGGFDVRDGRNLYGPPPRPLPRIVLEKRGENEVWAVGITQGSEHEAKIQHG
jgi:Rieske Fe-S protein